MLKEKTGEAMKLIIISLVCIMLLAVGMVINRLTISDQTDRLDRQDRDINNLIERMEDFEYMVMPALDTITYIDIISDTVLGTVLIDVFPDKHECCDSVGSK